MPIQDHNILWQTIVNQAVSTSTLQEALTTVQKLSADLTQARETMDAMARENATRDLKHDDTMKALVDGYEARIANLVGRPMEPAPMAEPVQQSGDAA